MSNETHQKSSRESRNLLFLHALTGLHPGSGTALGVVDLPVQRERHTQWPVIPGSSIKGVIRDFCRRHGSGDEKDQLLAVFGPESGNASEHAGALAFTDARILAFPVRSLKGVFAWVTCPGVLERLDRDLKLTGNPPLTPYPAPPEGKAVFGEELKVDNSIVLEEYDFGLHQGLEKLPELASWIAIRATADKATQERMKKHLVILHDNDFTHFVRHATEVTARIGLDYEKKTVKKGALFYQEFLPAETIFYSLALATPAKKPGKSEMTEEKVLGFVKEKLSRGELSVLQIGGDETIGKGLCAVRFMNGKGV